MLAPVIVTGLDLLFHTLEGSIFITWSLKLWAFLGESPPWPSMSVVQSCHWSPTWAGGFMSSEVGPCTLFSSWLPERRNGLIMVLLVSDRCRHTLFVLLTTIGSGSKKPLGIPSP